MSIEVPERSSAELSESSASSTSFSVENGPSGRQRKRRKSAAQKKKQDRSTKKEVKRTQYVGLQDFDPTLSFIGPKKKSQVMDMLEPQSFLLFYPIAEDEDSLTAPLRLQFAYKKTNGSTFFYPITHRAVGWSVQFDNDYVNVETQQMESLPYPEVADSSESDDTFFDIPDD
ncbi:hypothetical protein Q1695_008610 [Nippostrongylus brasiliensis]|nr:hypothetical protein Q1695_008610 [Nippostrongylus brasiliensis]